MPAKSVFNRPSAALVCPLVLIAFDVLGLEPNSPVPRYETKAEPNLIGIGKSGTGREIAHSA